MRNLLGLSWQNAMKMESAGRGSESERAGKAQSSWGTMKHSLLVHILCQSAHSWSGTPSSHQIQIALGTSVINQYFLHPFHCFFCSLLLTSNWSSLLLLPSIFFLIRFCIMMLWSQTGSICSRKIAKVAYVYTNDVICAQNLLLI